MPLIGIVDPSHTQRRGDPWTPPKWYPVDDILEQAYRADPRWSPWSYELLNVAVSEIQERGDHISTTALVSPCPRSVVLERKADYVGDIDALWRAFRGTMVHAVLERAQRPNSVAEVRFIMEFDDDELSCKPDLVTEAGDLWDYKNTENPPAYDYPYTEHTQQLQINRFVVNHADKWEADELPFNPRSLTFRHLSIMYLGPKWPKALETLKTERVPTKDGTGTKPRRVPDIWSDDKVTDLILPRFRALRAALESYPEWPYGVEEVWGGEPSWKCPGFPHCPLKGMCLASRYPEGMVW